MLLGGKEDGSYAAMSAMRTLLFLPFSLCLAAVNTLVIDSKMNKPGAFAIHALVMIPATYLCVFLPVDVENEASGSDRFLHFMFIAVAYVIVIAVILLCRRSFKKTLAEDEKYRKNKKN